MAAKRKKPANSKQKRKKNRTPFFRNEKFRFILGILVLLVAAYLLIAFISYLFYGAADQSKLDLKWTELVFNSSVKVQNKAGKTGAYLSELIINRGFGIASFIFIYLLIITGFKILGRNLVKYRKSFFSSLILLLWVSVTLGLIFTKTDGTSSIYPGGRYGFIMSNWLSSLVGVSGVVLLLLISAVIILVVRFDKIFALFKNIFWKKATREMEEETTLVVENEDILPEESISKVIEDDDVVKAIFEPDSDEDISDDELILESKKKEDVSEVNNEDEDLELTVHQKVEEEEGEGMSEELEDYDPTLDLSSFQFPTLDLLEDHKSGNAEVSNEELISNKNKIVETLRHYKIEITKIQGNHWPSNYII